MRTDDAAAAPFRPPVALGFALLAFLFTLRPLDFLMPALNLDDSWTAVLGEAAERPARWGVDLAFTYGPASALITRYFTASSVVRAVPIAVGVAAAYGLCFERLLALSRASRGQAVAAMAVAALVLAATRSDQDSFYFALALLVYLLDLRRSRADRASRVAVACGAAMMGVAGLSKTGFAVTGAAVFALADLRSATVVRRVPILVPLWIAGFGSAFLAYGQRVGDLPAFLRLQASVVSGYGEAMSVAGPRDEILGFLATAAALLAALALLGRPPSTGRLHRAFALFGTVVVLLVGFKAGFVRQDTHPQIAWLLLGLVCLVAAVGLVLPRSRPGASVLMGASLAIVWGVAPAMFLVETGSPIDRDTLVALGTDAVDTYASSGRVLGRVLVGPAGALADAEAAKAQAWAAIRALEPLPALAGTVDIIPSEQSAVLANGLDYDPRPSFQNYSTYTQALIDANTSFYTGPDAPDWVLFGADAIDGRFPTMVEGPLWPTLLSRYEPVLRAGSLLGLHRRAVPLHDVLGPADRRTATLGQPFTVPAGAVFAHVTVRKTLIGSLAAVLFRPPTLGLRVKLARGDEATYRFVPALGAGGFLISPLVASPDGFARLGDGLERTLAGDGVVEATVGGSRFLRLFYASDVGVEFQPVSVPDVQTGEDAQAFRRSLDAAAP